MEKARLDHISWLLEIIERECNHDLLLSVKNLQEVGASPFPYIVPILPHPLPAELVKGEHFVLTDLLKLIPRSSSQAESAPEPLVLSNCLPLSVQDPKLAPLPLAKQDLQLVPLAAKKKKRKTEHIKVTSVGLEGFVDWTDPIINESTEEMEAEMSSLAVGFAARMLKQAASAQGETTLGSDGLDEKRFKQSSSVEEVQISPTVIYVDSPKRAPGALSDLEGDARGASFKVCVSLEDRALVGEPSLDDKVTNEALLAEEAGGPPPWAKWPSLALSEAWRIRPPDKLIPDSYVKLLEWSHQPTDALAPDHEAAQLLVRKCNPFDKRDSLIAYMHNLYLHSLRVSVVAHYEEYSILFPNYMDKRSY